MRRLLYAHRGAAAELPENTLPAFARAIELGADAIETDAHLTALMVTHNMSLALHVGTRTLMMHEGQVILDLDGAERQVDGGELAARDVGAHRHRGEGHPSTGPAGAWARSGQ